MIVKDADFMTRLKNRKEEVRDLKTSLSRNIYRDNGTVIAEKTARYRWKSRNL